MDDGTDGKLHEKRPRRPLCIAWFIMVFFFPFSAKIFTTWRNFLDFKKHSGEKKIAIFFAFSEIK